MYDPNEPDVPHLGNDQPSWGDLPFASEIVKQHWDRSDETYDQVREKIKQANEGEESKINDVYNLLAKENLGVFDDETGLTEVGVALAQNYERSKQQKLDTDTKDDAVLGTKDQLGEAERAVYRDLLFERDWLPMVATLDLIEQETPSTGETAERAKRFRFRVEHLEEYESVNSNDAWKKKLQAHVKISKHLELVTEQADSLTLTDTGEEAYARFSVRYAGENDRWVTE